MKIKEGNPVKSVLTGKIYKIKTTRDWIVTLESLDGSSQVLTEKSNLNLFYEKVENLRTHQIFRIEIWATFESQPNQEITEVMQ